MSKYFVSRQIDWNRISVNLASLMKRLGAQMKQSGSYVQEQMVEIKMQVAAVTFSDPHSRAESHKNVQPRAASHLAARLD